MLRLGFIANFLSRPILIGFMTGVSLAIGDLVLGAGAVLIVGFGSGIVTARSFGAKNRYIVDANRELLGFGGANLASGLFCGFPVTASDSRTADQRPDGGKTQLAGLVSAAALAFAVMFLGRALSILPTPALEAVLASAAISLIDFDTLRALWRISRIEFAFAMISIAGVLGLGVLKGVVIAIGATLLYLVMKGLRPRDALLGRIPGRDGFFKLHRRPDAKPIPGLVVNLLQGSLLFFNAYYVKSRIETTLHGVGPDDAWFLFDAGSTAQIDSTAAAMLDDVRATVAERGLRFGIVELHSEPFDTLARAGVIERIGDEMNFADLEYAVASLQTRHARISRDSGAAQQATPQ